LTVALIELDLDAPPAQPASRPPAHYYRYVAAAACALLVLALGGAARTAAVLWQRTGLVPLPGPSSAYQLLGGLLYTLDSNSERRTTTAWSMRPVRRLWTVTTPVHVDQSGAVIQDGAGLGAAGRYTMLVDSNESTIIDPRSGRIRWTAPGLVASSGEVGIVQQTEFPDGTRYDESSGDPGELFWSEDGAMHTEPPDRTVLRGVDLGSGRELWRGTERGSGFVGPAGGGGAGFVVIAADRLSWLAAGTGAVVREHALPRFAGNDVSYPEVTGDLLILRHDVSDTGAGTVSAFGLDTLEQRWQVREAVRGDSAGGCLGLPCRLQRDSVTVLDPVTGVPAWSAPDDVMVSARGHEALELRGSGTVPLSVRDRRTGRVRVDLSGWQEVADSADDAPIVVFRAQPPSGRAGFGVLTPGAGRVQLLGLSADRVERCASDERFVACRTLRGIEVWSYLS